MEDWEVAMRAKLEAELPDEKFDISETELYCMVDKRTKIEFEIGKEKIKRFTGKD